jgi:GntR family transcriptional regulator
MIDARYDAQARVTGQRISAGKQLQGSAARAHTLLRAGIRDGTIVSEQQLVEENLVHTLGASRNAVRSALQMLVDDGLVSRAPKRGTEVISGIFEFALLPSPGGQHLARPPGSSHITRTEGRTVPPTGIVAQRLGYTGPLPIPMVEYVSSFDGRPTALRVSYHHPELDPERYEEFVDGFLPRHEYNPSRPLFTPADAIAALYGSRAGTGRTVIEAQLCDARTAKLLDLSIGAPLLVRETVISDIDGQPRILTHMAYDGSRVTLSHESTEW